MVNCNPETVSTDYDTSDRLYFEPLDTESVLAICEREQPDGVVIQFGGQTPLKLARTIEDAGYRILGTPFDAVDLAEDRERFAGLLARARAPLAGVGDRRDAGRGASRSPSGSATRCSCRPSYVLGGRAMRVCYDGRRRARRCLRSSAMLVDRFVEHAVEVDVDALCDGVDTYIAAVMQHVEEAGVHSGDSSCVLPAPSLSFAQTQEIAHVVRRPRARARRSRAPQRPARGHRRRRGLRARGESARVADGALREQGDRSRARQGGVPARARGDDRRARAAAGAAAPRQCSVKAAVLPFARFPGERSGARAGDALDRRGDGERRRPRRPRSTRPSGPPGARCRVRVRRSSPSATPTRWPCRSRATLAASASSWYATEGTAATLAAAGIARRARCGSSARPGGEPTVVD